MTDRTLFTKRAARTVTPTPLVSPPGPDVDIAVSGELITSAWGTSVSEDLEELWSDKANQAALDAHIAGPLTAHPATFISATPNAAPMTGIDVQTQLAQAAAALGAGGGGATTSVVVAASDAPAFIRDNATLVCDGTNDQVEIQAAHDMLSANGGKIELSYGTFNISATIFLSKDSVTLAGIGVGQRGGATQLGVGTKLVAVSGLVGAVLSVSNLSGTTPVYGATLRDFTIDGVSLAGPIDGVHFRSNRGLVERVHVHRCTGNGIRLQGYSVPNFDTYDTHVALCQVGDCGLAGVFYDTDSPDCHLLSCILYNNQWNVRIKSGSEQITACHFYNATKNNVWFDSSGSRTKLSNCKIEGAGEHGIWLDGTTAGTSDVQITGCNFKNSGDSADNTFDHIDISGPTANGHTRTTIVGNTFAYQSSVTPNKPRYGVNLEGSSSQRSTIVGNSFGPATHFGTAPVLDNSNITAPALIHNNTGVSETYGGPFLSVKDFGARGDGAADDTAAIQSAIDAVPVGGGWVWFPSGRYEISAPLLVKNDGIILIGAGSGNYETATQDGWGARIEVDPAFVGSEVIRFQRAANDRTLFGGGIQDLTISCGLIGTLNAVMFNVEHGFLSNVGIYRASGNGLVIQGYVSWKAEHNKITNCWFETCTGRAIVLSTESIDNLIQGCTFVNNGYGIETLTTDHRYVANTFTGTVTNHLLFVGAGSRTQVLGNRFDNSGQHGIILDSTTVGFDHITFTGNAFENAGTSATNTYDEVFVTGPSGNAITRLAFTGNAFYYQSSETANKPRYGLNLSGSCSQSTAVSGNTFGPATHWGTAAINDNSNASFPAVVRGNVNISDSAFGIKADTTTGYAPVLGDQRQMITLSNAGTITVTLPSNATTAFQIGTEIEFLWLGVGQPVFVAGGGATVNGTPGLKLRAQYSACTAKKIAASAWVLIGDLAA